MATVLGPSQEQESLGGGEAMATAPPLAFPPAGQGVAWAPGWLGVAHSWQPLSGAGGPRPCAVAAGPAQADRPDLRKQVLTRPGRCAPSMAAQSQILGDLNFLFFLFLFFCCGKIYIVQNSPF